MRLTCRWPLDDTKRNTTAALYVVTYNNENDVLLSRTGRIAQALWNGRDDTFAEQQALRVVGSNCLSFGALWVGWSGWYGDRGSASGEGSWTSSDREGSRSHNRSSDRGGDRSSDGLGDRVLVSLAVHGEATSAGVGSPHGGDDQRQKLHVLNLIGVASMKFYGILYILSCRKQVMM
jgi:hypothetical protein